MREKCRYDISKKHSAGVQGWMGFGGDDVMRKICIDMQLPCTTIHNPVERGQERDLGTRTH